MACLYAGKEYASVEERNSYLQGLKPLKYEDLQESFEGFPAASSDDAFCKVTLLYASELYARKEWFLKGRNGLMVIPDICALIERTFPDGTTRRVLFDAGVRKNSKFNNPVIKKMSDHFRIGSPYGAGELVQEVGVDLKDIEGVYISHMHFDHCGDIGEFPKSTRLCIGPNVPTEPEKLGPLLDVDPSVIEGREIRIFSEEKGKVGALPLFEDVFGDGSMLILATMGHTPHHTSALVRVSTEGNGKYILFGGDTCHHISMLHPNPETGETSADSLAAEYHPEFAPKVCACSHEDLDSSYRVMARTARMDAEPNCLVILAHDDTIAPLMAHHIIHKFNPAKDWEAFKNRDLTRSHKDVYEN